MKHFKRIFDSLNLINILYGICFCLAILALLKQYERYHDARIYVQAIAQAVEPEVKRVALTFDDGPHPIYTEQLLDGLDARGIKVTFFVTGENAALHPDIIKRMHDEGHLIGNHTYSHIQLTSSNREQFRDELIKTNELIQSITGDEVQYVRPPYGSWDKTFETELNMFPVLWNIDPLDWCSSNANRVARSVINAVSENNIILMHDYYDSSVEAALMIVDELTKRGYEFVTVDRILFD